MEYMRNREAKHRDTNGMCCVVSDYTTESTNNRIFWFSIISLAAVITTAYLQLKHLTSYFRSKKIN